MRRCKSLSFGLSLLHQQRKASSEDGFSRFRPSVMCSPCRLLPRYGAPLQLAWPINNLLQLLVAFFLQPTVVVFLTGKVPPVHVGVSVQPLLFHR